MLFSSAEYPLFLLAVFFMFALLRADGATGRVARVGLFLLLGDLVYLLLAKDTTKLFDPLGGVLYSLATHEHFVHRAPLDYLLGTFVFAAAVFLGYRRGARLNDERTQKGLGIFAAAVLVVMGTLILIAHFSGPHTLD